MNKKLKQTSEFPFDEKPGKTQGKPEKFVFDSGKFFQRNLDFN